MLFTKTFSAVLATALLATSALGSFTDAKRSSDDVTILARTALTDIGPGPVPAFKEYKKYFSTYCNKAIPKGKGKRDVEERDIQARGPPSGYTDIPMGRQATMLAAGPGLYSGGFGSCVGLLVTGTPATAHSAKAVMAHLSMGQTWSDMQSPYVAFVNAVTSARMTNMKGYIYTLDTTLSKDPTYKGDSDMESEAAGVAEVYAKVKSRLQALVGTGSVTVQTHSFQHVGEMWVSPAGVPGFSLA